MTTIKALIPILLVFTFSGCYCSFKKPEPQIVVKTEYIKEDKYNFEKVNTDGLYIETETKELQSKCTPLVLETSSIFRGIVDFYDWQIDEYGKEDKNDSTSKEYK